MLDFSEETKQSQLSAAGWESDHVGQYDSVTNAGFLKRRAKFIISERKSGTEILAGNQEFRTDGVSFVGRLRTHLENCHQGLIPGADLTIRLLFTNSDFSVWTPTGTEIEYKLFIEECELYVPIAQLNREINNHLENELNKAAAFYFFREMRCQVFPINKNATVFISQDLRTPGQAAIKIYIGLVKRTAFEGHQNENP